MIFPYFAEEEETNRIPVKPEIPTKILDSSPGTQNITSITVMKPQNVTPDTFVVPTRNFLHKSFQKEEIN